MGSGRLLSLLIALLLMNGLLIRRLLIHGPLHIAAIDGLLKIVIIEVRSVESLILFKEVRLSAAVDQHIGALEHIGLLGGLRRIVRLLNRRGLISILQKAVGIQIVKREIVPGRSLRTEVTVQIKAVQVDIAQIQIAQVEAIQVQIVQIQVRKVLFRGRCRSGHILSKLRDIYIRILIPIKEFIGIEAVFLFKIEVHIEFVLRHCIFPPLRYSRYYFSIVNEKMQENSK